MLKDFNQAKEFAFDTDVCIIGSGAAGLASALTLVNSGLKVIIVEGGLKAYNAKAADLHRGHLTSQHHSGIHDARERIVGGTTTKWGGQAFPFFAEDFEIRPYVNQSGWPLSLQDIEPYYRKAEKILGTDDSIPFTYRPWKEWHVREPDFSPLQIDLFVTKWCKIPNLATQHISKIENSSDITLLINANVVELLPTDELNAVKAIRIFSLEGREGLIKAKYIIAAGGALETVRLFLSSRKFGKSGAGNKLTGYYFQDHVATVAGQIFPYKRKWFHDVFDPFYKKSFKYFPRIKINPAMAKKLEILHTSAQVIFSHDENSVLGNIKAVVSALRRKSVPGRSLLQLFMKPSKITQILSAAIRWKIRNRGTSPMQGPVWLEIHSEQNPAWDSVIKLSDETDDFGMPRISLNWTISDLTIKTIRTMATLIQAEFERTSFAKVALEPWITNKAEDPRKWLGDVFHQSGGLRMANNEYEGVVDSNCRVFGVDNLYVASSAVFPTSSFSNPTMTIIALSIRVTETVMDRLKSK